MASYDVESTILQSLIMGACDVVLATLEEAAALVECDAGAEHGALGGTAVGAGATGAGLKPVRTGV
jgi:hypothetical protein